MKLIGIAILIALAGTGSAHADGTLAFKPGLDTPKCTTTADVSIAIEVVARGAWLGTSTGTRCFVARKDGALDLAALDTELATIVAALAPGCSTSVEVAATPGVVYQDVVTAMDHAVKAGLPQLALGGPKDLAISFDDSAAKEKQAPPHCSAPVSPAKPAPVPASSKPSHAAPSQDPAVNPDVALAPIVVITTTEVEFMTDPIARQTIGTVKSLAHGKGAIAKLVALMKKATLKRALILQADASTDVGLVNRVIASAHQAGIADVLFAVKNK